MQSEAQMKLRLVTAMPRGFKSVPLLYSDNTTKAKHHRAPAWGVNRHLATPHGNVPETTPVTQTQRL